MKNQADRRRLIDDIHRSRRTQSVRQYRYTKRLQNTTTRHLPSKNISKTQVTAVGVSKPKPAKSLPSQEVAERASQKAKRIENKELLRAAASIQTKDMRLPSKRTPWTSIKKKKEETVRSPMAMHLAELQRRLLWVTVALILGSIAGYVYNEQVISFLVHPLNEKLYYTSPTGGFDFLIKTCLFFGFLLAVPVIVYHFVQFLAPALPKHVHYSIFKILIISKTLAIAGVLFAYFISLPAALHFLGNFSNNQIESLIDAREYFNFVMIYLAGFAALFQMPLIIAFINKIKRLSPRSLMKKQRFVILISFIVAAVLTPTPDPINQAIMAAPMIGLYQVSVGVIWQTQRRNKHQYDDDELNISQAMISA